MTGKGIKHAIMWDPRCAEIGETASMMRERAAIVRLAPRPLSSGLSLALTQCRQEALTQCRQE